MLNVVLNWKTSVLSGLFLLDFIFQYFKWSKPHILSQYQVVFIKIPILIFQSKKPSVLLLFISSAKSYILSWLKKKTKLYNYNPPLGDHQSLPFSLSASYHLVRNKTYTTHLTFGHIGLFWTWNATLNSTCIIIHV